MFNVTQELGEASELDEDVGPGPNEGASGGEESEKGNPLHDVVAPVADLEVATVVATAGLLFVAGHLVEV